MPEQKRSDAVVVGCDRSAPSQAAVATATLEAARRGVALVLLAVNNARADVRAPGKVPRNGRWPPETTHVAGRRAAMVAEATDPAVPVEVVALAPEDGAEVDVLAARTVLFVLPVRGLGGIQGLSLESMTDEVIGRADCPVMIPHIKGPAHQSLVDEGRRHTLVYVVLPGRPDDVVVLRYAARESRLRGVSLWVIRAFPRAACERAFLNELSSAWQTVQAVPECASLLCHVEVVMGHLAVALLARCQPDDLVVVGGRDGVGPRGRGTVVELVRGSALRGILDALTCDVMVVPLGALDRRFQSSRQTARTLQGL